MENKNPEKPALKTVKATATSPVYAIFDIVKLEGKDVVTGTIGFVDQFGMERMAKTAGEKGVLNLGKHVLAIFEGKIDVIEPDDETKAKLAKQVQEEVLEAKQDVANAYEAPKEEKKDEQP